jgi:hypothetical protein
MNRFTVIETYNDPVFDKIEDEFYSNFSSDDWTFIFIANDNRMRKTTIERAIRTVHPTACDYQFAKVNDRWMAVSYHS